MVNSATDRPSRVRRVLRLWPMRIGFIVLGLVIVIWMLNVLPTIHDPTEGVFPVRIVNALGRTVELRLCKDEACWAAYGIGTRPCPAG